MAHLAINGGEKARTKPWPSWPVWDEREIKALEEVVRSGRWGRIYEGSKVEEFENLIILKTSGEEDLHQEGGSRRALKNSFRHPAAELCRPFLGDPVELPVGPAVLGDDLDRSESLFGQPRERLVDVTLLRRPEVFHG